MCCRLVISPHIEPAELVDKLSLRGERALGSHYSLFTSKPGRGSSQPNFRTTMIGNTLAYVLTAVQNLTELQTGWSNLDTPLISEVVRILTIPTNMINFCRCNVEEAG